jgi:multidrug resistance efflux pump
MNVKAWLLLAALALPGAATLLYAARRTPPGEDRAADPASGAAVEDRVEGVGYVEPVSEVRRLSFKNSGVICASRARLGATFRKGEVLLSLRNAEERAAMLVAENELAVARARRAKVFRGLNHFQVEAAGHKVAQLRERLTRVRRDAERARRLRSTRSVSDEEDGRLQAELGQTLAGLREAEANHRYAQSYVTAEDRQVAQTQVELAAARLELSRARYEETLLRAPCDGQVLEVLKREGDAVRLTDVEPVLLFADLSRCWVRAEVEDRFLCRLRQGQRALLYGRGLGTPLPGHVVLIKSIMGRKTVFSGASTERRDLDVVQVFVEPRGPFNPPVGLRVDVKVLLED